ncbi:MAG: bifunctional precorrin-2 dehydrogenase/sirohydrochlorin ferrochelatase [Haloplanus sp.]
MIPLVHDFEGETVVVFGGGRAGARKARRFAREARVVVVSPEFADADFGAADRVRAAPTPADVPDWLDAADPALVVAATDDEAFNAAVERHARERGALVNRADRRGGRDAGSVVVPATIREGTVQVAVATGGTAPAVSRRLRRELEETVAGAGLVADVTAALREEFRAGDRSPAERRAAVRAVAESVAVWRAAETGDRDAVRAAAERAVADAESTGDA